jgi:uncharacterized membrane protein
MKKREFFHQMKTKLQILNKVESSEILRYYDEMIQDAVDSGENEAEFIDRLGDIEDIIDTIRTDDTFVQKLRKKRDEVLLNALSTSAKIIGWCAFAFAVFIVFIVGISFVFAGLATIVYSGVQLFVITDPTSALILKYISNIVFGFGMVILAIGGYQLFYTISKKTLNHVFRKVNQWIKKGDRSHEQDY